ncbi:MAG: hypothetical protein H7318_12490 [Oligoflexus sp.]|nr:hypothetical protein [Oligoflexus sp.]
MSKIFAHWKQMFGSLLLWTLLSACGNKQPTVVDESQKNPKSSISHVNLTSNCAQCHEPDRKAPAVDLVTVQHGLGADCSDCHAFPVFTVIKAEAKTHVPPPKACMGCHDRVTAKTSHVARGECAGCHRFGAAWAPF